MDFESIKNRVSNLTLYDIKAGVRQVQNAVMNLTEMEAKVREATNADPWGASATLMQEIASGTHNYQQLNEIMPMIYKRFTDKTAEEWRQIYKALQLLEFLVKNGSERVVDDARSHLSLIRMLRQFHYIDQNGKDQGVNVRNRSGELVKLLGDVDMIRAERKKARANRNKYGGVEGGAGLGGFSSGGSRYGGFGSESAGFGTYQGEVYGDGGGFGGRETDFSATQRRGEQFEEYDEGEEGAARPSASKTRAPPAPAVKKLPAKQKEPEQDLFDFGEEPVVVPGSGQAPSTSVLDVSGPAQAATSRDDDDFDDFQSAASPAAVEPAANPLTAILSPPPPVGSTTTQPAQFASPKPAAPAQSANLSNFVSQSTISPSTAATPSSVTASSPQSQKTPVQPAQSQFKPTGPNYYASVNASINSTSSNTSAFASKPGSRQVSYTSSTSAANLGKPAAKPVASGGGDAFANLWSTAGSTAGVQKKQTAKGPDLASMAKAKTEAGLWGATAGTATSTGPSQAGTGGVAAPKDRPNQPLGNGLDDLLG